MDLPGLGNAGGMAKDMAGKLASGAMEGLSSLIPDAGSLLASFASAFSQSGRLVKLNLAGTGEALLATEARGHEALNGCYRYEVEALSSSAKLPVKKLLGRAAAVEILLPDGGHRVVTGLVSEARNLGGDGGFARYGLVIEPALALLKRTRGSRIWQGKTAPEIVEALLAEAREASAQLGKAFAVENQLKAEYPALELRVMHRESVGAFIERTLAEAGIRWTWAFADGDTPVHTLVLYDDPYGLESCGSHRYHRASGSETSDGITAWEGKASVEAGTATFMAWDEASASVLEASQGSWLEQEEDAADLSGALAWHEGPSPRWSEDGEGLTAYTERIQRHADRLSEGWRGEGSVRELQAGRWFTLTNHPDGGFGAESEFTITRLEIEARSNIEGLKGLDALKGLLGSKGPGPSPSAPEAPFKARFEAVRRATAVPPDPCPKPQAWGSQVAQVVGPSGEEVYTDELGRVRVKFFWMRDEDHAEPGPEGPCTCWLRVAYPAAGSGIGFQSIPRVGDEVVVSFLEGNLDRPLVTGVVHNGRNATPRFGGAGSLPANRTLTGLRTREHGGGLSSELLFDDTQGQVRARLATDAASSALNLGAITHPRMEGSADGRGEGFELRTDGFGALRAGGGLLISADERQRASGPQLSREEVIAQLEMALSLARALGEASNRQQAEGTDLDGQEAFRGRVKDWPTADSEEPPPLVVSAPGGIGLASPLGLHLATESSLEMTAARDANLSLGKRLRVRAAEAIHLFAQKLGIRIIAAKGPVDLQAQDGPIQIISEQDLRIASVKGTIQIASPDHLVISAGQARIELQGGNLNVELPGKITFKAAQVEVQGPGGSGTSLASAPKGELAWDERLVLFEAKTGEPIPNRRYRIQMEDGQVVEGVTDSEGRTNVVASETSQRFSFEIFPKEANG